MTAPLYAFLSRQMALPFIWGETDCMMMLADWCLVNGWPDPAADYRLTYHDQSSCQRETRFLTDPLDVTSRCFAAVGMAVTGDPREGDVGVVQIGPRRFAGAIKTAYGWVSKADEGVTYHDAPAMRAWSVGYVG